MSTRTNGRRLVALPGFGAVVATLCFAAGASGQDNLGKTTFQERIVPSGEPGFRYLGKGPGEFYVVREEGLGKADPGRAERRTSLLYFGQLSDFQLADEESPARVEFVDTGPFSAAWRPWEAMNPQIDDAMVRQINAFVPASPIPAGDGSRRPMDFVIGTGDLADSQQLNETEWVRTLLEGGTLNPGSGTVATASTDPSCLLVNPVTVPDAATPEAYTGVQDYDDYVEGPTPQFYDPDSPAGAFSAWPNYDNLMDRAQQPFEAAGLDVPSYVAIGNHDALVQGNAAANSAYESVATGCVKPMSPVVTDSTLGDALAGLDPANLASLLAGGGTALVPPDPKRQFVSKPQLKAVYKAGAQADGHGFGYVDPAEEEESAGAAGYYSWIPKPGFRFISLDSVSDAGVIGPSADGNIDHPQFLWLRSQLEQATAQDQLVVLFSHHAIPSLTANVPDETAPPCTSTDTHGHDVNPGCDLDPRNSAPIHLGADLEALLLEFPHVIGWVAGHSHVNSIEPHPSPSGKGGFWSIRVAAEADWPQQTRLLEIFDNADGTLSIVGTIVDHASAATAPPPGTDAAALTPMDLASIGRTISYNDSQSGGRACGDTPCGEGNPDDRNVELLLADPRRSAGGGTAGRCTNNVPGTKKRDRLKGTAGGDRLRGRGGNDRLNGKAGRDCVQGGRGNDRITGGKDADTLKGGGGRDRIKARDGDRDQVRCGAGKDRVKADKKDRVKKSCERVKRRK